MPADMHTYLDAAHDGRRFIYLLREIQWALK